jgi:CheY-like chemotaxis protein
VSARAKILIIDDDEDYRASTRTLLEGEGYEVIEARGGREGLQAVREQRPDLVVLDVMMESLAEGYSVNQAIKFHPDYRDLGPIPIIMVSSVEMDPAGLYDWIGDTSRITPDAYLAKPLDLREFLDCVDRLLKQP